MSGRYTGWAGPLEAVGRFEWERIVKKCDFKQMSTKLVALLMATYANEDGGRIYPGRERLAAVAGLSTKQVSRALVKLEDLGLVLKLSSGSSIGKRGLASVYQLTAPNTLHQLFQDDPDELERLVHELAWEHYESMNQGTRMSPASALDQGTYEADQGTYATNQGTYEADQGTRMSPHHVSNTKDLSSSININPSIPFAAASPKLTHAKKPVDNHNNGSYTGQGMEDERRRQMDALEALIEKERIAS